MITALLSVSAAFRGASYASLAARRVRDPEAYGGATDIMSLILTGEVGSSHSEGDQTTAAYEVLRASRHSAGPAGTQIVATRYPLQAGALWVFSFRDEFIMRPRDAATFLTQGGSFSREDVI